MKLVRVEITFGYGQSRTPLVSQDIQAYATVGIDVWVIDASSEVYFWWFERIIGREMNRQKEYTTRVGAFTLYVLSATAHILE